MSRQSREVRKLDRIRSVSIEDIVNGRHTRWRRFLRKAKRVAAVITIGAAFAAAGAVAYFVATGPGDRLVITFRAPEPITAVPLPEPAEAPPLEAYLEAPAAAHDDVLTGPPDLSLAHAGFTPAGEEAIATASLAYTAPVVPREAIAPEEDADAEGVARMPTPRPDAPIVTGSIRRQANTTPPPPAAEPRRFRPCRTLQQLTSRVPFMHLECGG